MVPWPDFWQNRVDAFDLRWYWRSAQTALAEAGIQLCSGAQGNTDEVVEL